MTSRLTAENAVIKTVAVEIKALTISGKQVTLAVFRQLPDVFLLDHLTLEELGVPWGRVNYHPDKCSDRPNHIHIVWQKGETLLRATMFEIPHFCVATQEELAMLSGEYAASIIGEMGDHPGANTADSLIRLDEYGYNCMRGTLHFRGQALPFVIECRGSQYDQQKAKRQVRASWVSGGSTPSSATSPKLARAIKAHDEWMLKYDSYYQSMLAIDQLYIAV